MANTQRALGIASEWIQTVKSTVGSGLGTAEEFIRKHPVTSAVTVGGGVLAGGAVTQIIRKTVKRRAAAKRKPTKARAKKKGKGYQKRSKRSWQLDRARISKQKHEVAYQKRKKKLKRSKSKKRVGKTYYTKKGQPYKILRSGKAKFIKKTKGRKR